MPMVEHKVEQMRTRCFELYPLFIIGKLSTHFVRGGNYG